MALSLNEFRKCIGADGGGEICELAGGTHVIDSPLIIGRSNIEIRGEVHDGRNLSILQRGEVDEGELFSGPLITGAGVSEVIIHNLGMNGIHRAAPSHFEADVLLLNAGNIVISNLILNHPVRHGIAIGPRSHDITINRVTVRGAGNYGIWAGAALTDRPVLPLADDVSRALPANLRLDECHFEDCGSAALYLEAAHVVVRACTLKRNHCDFPFDSDGGQLEIDYKSHDITVDSCAIIDGPAVERGQRLFRCVGIEAYGSHLVFRNNRIEGNSHEGIHLNAASHVTIDGNDTIIANNHTARRQYASVRNDPIQNISITTTSDFAVVNALAADLQVEDITCENGILVWTNGSVEGLRIDGLKIRNCSFPGISGDGVIVGKNADGTSLRGEGWSPNLGNHRSEELRLTAYGSDKVDHGYLERYDRVLEPWIGAPIVLLELGVHTGASLMLWRDYFPRGRIVGIDIDLSQSTASGERIYTYQGNQADTQFLSRVAREVAPDGFDIIIDDASHIGELTKVSFWHLFDNHLKPSGLYVIEDWGTGYWDDWPDGKSLDFNTYASQPSFWARLAGAFNTKAPMPCHGYGMVGFLKQLVDEQAAHDVTRRNRSGVAQRTSKFTSITFTPSIVFVRKAGL
jgi:hypothetical protein